MLKINAQTTTFEVAYGKLKCSCTRKVVTETSYKDVACIMLWLNITSGCGPWIVRLLCNKSFRYANKYANSPIFQKINELTDKNFLKRRIYIYIYIYIVGSNYIDVTLSIVTPFISLYKIYFLLIQLLNYNYLSWKSFIPNFIKIEHQ